VSNTSGFCALSALVNITYIPTASVVKQQINKAAVLKRTTKKKEEEKEVIQL
jgi:hypothetical protein